MRVFGEVSSSQLLEVVWVSLGAGLAITAIFSFALRWSANFDAARRDGRDGAATLYAALSVLALIVFFVGVVVGVRIMLKK